MFEPVCAVVPCTVEPRIHVQATLWEGTRDMEHGLRREENTSNKIYRVSFPTASKLSFHPEGEFWKMAQDSNFRIISAKM